MLSPELQQPKEKTVFGLAPTVLSLLFFALIFYFRGNQNDFGVSFTFGFVILFCYSFMFNKIEMLFLLVLITTSSIFDLMEFPTIPIMIGDLHFSDMLLLVLIGGRLLKRATMDIIIIPKPMGYPILAMISVATFSFIYSIMSSSVSVSRAGLDLRIFFYFSLFFLVFYYVRTPKQLNSLLLGIAVIACVLAFLQILQWISGENANILHGRVEQVVTAGKKFKNTIFVKFPGMAVILFSLNTLFAVFVFTKIKLRWQLLVLVAIALLSLGMIATFARTLWVSVIVAFTMIMFFRRERITAYLRAALLVGSAAAIIFFTLQDTGIAKVFNPTAFFDRSISTFSAFKNYRDDTLFMRILEYKFAWQKITENPIMGIGFGNSYRPSIFAGSGYEKNSMGTWVHNGYIAVQMRMGILGTFAFLWMMIAFFRRFFRSWRKVQNPLYRAVVVGIAAGMACWMITNLTSSTIFYLYWIVIASIAMGITEKIYQFEGIK